jgi:hypothetical protein
MSDKFSPNGGVLAGIAWGDAISESEVEREKQRLIQQSKNLNIKRMSEEAQANAMIAVANGIMAEVTAIDGGAQISRRLSDPANVAARAEDFIDTAGSELNRLSSGRLRFTEQSVRSVKKSGRELSEHFQKSVVQPEPELVAKGSKPKI